MTHHLYSRAHNISHPTHESKSRRLTKLLALTIVKPQCSHFLASNTMPLRASIQQVRGQGLDTFKGASAQAQEQVNLKVHKNTHATQGHNTKKDLVEREYIERRDPHKGKTDYTSMRENSYTTNSMRLESTLDMCLAYNSSKPINDVSLEVLDRSSNRWKLLVCGIGMDLSHPSPSSRWSASIGTLVVHVP